MFVAITDSGLGGLSVCAALERDVRAAAPTAPVRLTYINAWPEEGRGYNDLPDMAARADAFDRVLDAITATHPDELLIACNTLSILYPMTRFSRSPAFAVRGIVDAGVSLFVESLAASPQASIVLLGTRTTIESGTHRNRLVAAGLNPERITSVSCHGLATAIERDIDGPAVGELIAACAGSVLEAQPSGRTVFAGFCCTHYGYVARRISTELAAALGRPVVTLDPNVRMVLDVTPDLRAASAGNGAGTVPTVEVWSKVVLDDRTRRGVAGLVRPLSPATADALLGYRHIRNLF